MSDYITFVCDGEYGDEHDATRDGRLDDVHPVRQISKVRTAEPVSCSIRRPR